MFHCLASTIVKRAKHQVARARGRKGRVGGFRRKERSPSKAACLWSKKSTEELNNVSVSVSLQLSHPSLPSSCSLPVLVSYHIHCIVVLRRNIK